MTTLRPLLMAILLATPACLADKGAEDDIPTDGKFDSFASPTSHGDLAFGIDNQATFSDDEGFHSWTFTLTDTAKVALETELRTQNLDTVMYLYKRASGSDSWGAYVERNDDASEDSAASRLELDLEAAEYRVLVKAYKRTQRGDFALTGACSGAGCPTTQACNAAVELPADTGYGGQCGAKLAAVYEYASIDATSSTDLSLADRCNAPELERRAMDYYASYFSNLSGDLEPDVELSVETRVLGGAGSNGGTLVDVTDGGDESGMTFVFDTAGDLVLLYQHNQSPDVQFFCKEPGAQALTVPSVEDCVGALVSSVPHDGDEEADVGLTASLGNLPIGLGAEVSRPMQRYAAKQGVSNFTSIIVDGANWDTFGDKASRLTISTANKPKVAYIATGDMVVLEGGALVCE